MRIAIIVLLVFQSSMLCYSQSDQDKVDETVDMNMIKGQIHFLALDALKGRDTGSPGLALAADFIDAQFRSFGVGNAPGMKSYRQSVPFTTVIAPNESTITLRDNIILNAPDDFFILSSDNGIYEAEVVYANYGFEEDYNELNVKDKIVLLNGGDGESDNPQAWYYAAKEKKAIALRKGAKAIIEIYANPKSPYNFVKRYLAGGNRVELGHSAIDESDIPHMWLNGSNENYVASLKAAGSKIKIDVSGSERNEFNSDNLVGFVEGSDPTLKDEVIVYSAHYDHVGINSQNGGQDSIYNGARDNAVGAITVLSAAENIARYPTKRSALFILFTAEEKGLLGSKWFVDNSPMPLEKIVYCFNSDNGGYNDTSLATIVGLTRTTAQSLIEESCEIYDLKAIEDPAKEQGLFDRSDNVNFAVKGIPAPTYSMGFTAFDEEIFKYYHQPGDHADGLDYEYLFKFFSSYVLSARKIANAQETPFWIEGDKYYEAGLELYDGKK